jgi:phosphate starvation-inducible PhoH-like protein
LEKTQKRLELDDQDLALKLSGPHSALLRELSRQSGATVSLRGNTLHILGEEEAAELAFRFLEGAAKMTAQGHEVSVADVAHSLRALRAGEEETLEDLLSEVILTGAGRRPIAPKTAGQKRYIGLIRKHDLTFGIGPAGTGKTYLAMAMAASALLKRKVKRIVLTRPAVEAGERLGFLPGDLAEKVNPYLRPLYDALGDMMDYEKVQQLRSRGQIEVAPLAFMRGRTLNDCFVILDEAQNATSDQMKMFLTRLGYGSTAVVTGDVTQTDLPRGARCGLREAQVVLADVEGIAFHHFTDVDVVRHPLVQRIVVAYDQHEEARILVEETEREQAKREAQTAPLPSEEPEASSPETQSAEIPETRASWAPPPPEHS